MLVGLHSWERIGRMNIKVAQKKWSKLRRMEEAAHERQFQSLVGLEAASPFKVRGRATHPQKQG